LLQAEIKGKFKIEFIASEEPKFEFYTSLGIGYKNIVSFTKNKFKIMINWNLKCCTFHQYRYNDGLLLE
jgi:hypothetical protein